MWRELDSILLDELLHPAQVVLELAAIEHSQRQAEILAQEIPSELGDLFGCGGVVEEAEPFVKWRDFIVGRAGVGQGAVSVAKVRISPAVDARPELLYL